MTQKELILKYIDDHGSITSFQAYADLGITQLATRIKELKSKGYEFRTVPETNNNKQGKPVHYVRYFIN